MPAVPMPATYEEAHGYLTIRFNGKVLPECVRVLYDNSTQFVIGYMTTNAKYFAKAADAVTEQLTFALNPTPLDNFLIIWRTNKDFPFYTTGPVSSDRFVYLYGDKRPDGSKKVFIKVGRTGEPDVITNHSDTTVLICDKCHDRVVLIPAGCEAVIPERL